MLVSKKPEYFWAKQKKRTIIRQHKKPWEINYLADLIIDAKHFKLTHDISHKTKNMDPRSTKLAGILLIILPTVAFGGTSLLTLLISPESGYMENPLRQDLWRAGHAHAGIMLILSLVILKYVDEANLSTKMKHLIRNGTPLTAILLPLAFFLSVLKPESTEPNAFIYLAYLAFGILTITLLILGIGLIRKK